MTEVLVLGYGNPLRRDDAVGPLVAEMVSRWEHPGVQALALPQLLPELAESLSRVRLAIFVDAGLDFEEVRLRPLAPAPCEPSLHHTGDPSWLLSLARAVYGRCPPAWLVTIPTADVGFGEGLSSSAHRGLEVALQQIERLLLDER